MAEQNRAQQARWHHYKTMFEIQLEITQTSELERISDIEIETLISQLSESVQKFETAHLGLMNVSEDQMEEEKEIFREFSKYYFLAVMKLKKALKGKQQVAIAQRASVEPIQTVDAASASIEHLKIQPFNGDYSDWQRFHSMFKAIVHDKIGIPPIVKFAKLLSVLGPEVKPLMAGYQQTGENYEQAWNALKERYNNEQSIVFALVNKLLNLPQTKVNDGKTIWKLVDSVKEIVQQLRVLNVPVDHWGAIIAFLILKQLDAKTRMNWEFTQANHNRGSLPNVQDLVQFLENQASALMFLQNCEANEVTENAKRKSSEPQRKAKACVLCGEAHRLFRCSRFKTQELPDRLKSVRVSRVCQNCFMDHKVDQCPQSKCRVCFKEKHNVWLCPEQEARMKSRSKVNLTENSFFSTSLQDTPADEMQSALLVSRKDKEVQKRASTLATLCAMVKTSSKEGIAIRALCDPGSQVNLITADCVKRLGLKMVPKKDFILLAGGDATHKLQGKVELTIRPAFRSDYEIVIQASVIGKISSATPHTYLQNNWHPLKGLQLADEKFFIPRHSDVLLGASTMATIAKTKVIKLDQSAIAQETEFGYIVYGEMPTQVQNQKCHITTKKENEDLANIFERFWKIHEPEKAASLTPEEQFCEKFFLETTTRNHEGRYVVRLPFKPNKDRLGNSLGLAIQRTKALERKCEKSPAFKEKFQEFIEEYEKLGHLKRINYVQSESIGEEYFIPLHAVENPKFRIVFDATAKTTSGKSLNDVMFIGPRLQDELFAIAMRFRYHRIALAADIVKMYRQVLVHEKDQNYQQIVWGRSQDGKWQILKLNTVTYGTSSAPYLAVRALQQCAKDYQVSHPKASHVALRDFYVDDLLTGGDSEEEVVKLFKETRDMLLKGGFELDKWVTNSKTVAERIRSNSDAHKKINDTETTGILGSRWSPKDDAFVWSIKNEPLQKLTKRSIASRVGRIFDPIGYLQPVVINSKVIMQELWKSGGGWDDVVPDIVRTQWHEFENNLRGLNELKVQRWLGTSMSSPIEIHGFCDASCTAYAAVLYIRTKMEKKSAINILAARSRVAPIRSCSIPRLELCAAMLLIELYLDIIKIFKSFPQMSCSKAVFWTDSTIVLHWIRKLPCQLKTFVANRIAKIQETSKNAKWLHVPSSCNPADAATRGMTAAELRNSKLWWTGPEWLSNENKWPSQPNCLTAENQTIAKQEEKVEVSANVVMYSEPLLPNAAGISIDKRFSSLHKLQRIVAIVLKFIRSIKNKDGRKLTLQATQDKVIPTSKEDLDGALLLLIVREQRIHFRMELTALNKQEEVPGKSCLRQLRPFVDENGLIRLGSRAASQLAHYDTRYPIIIPSEGRLVQLLVEDAHKRTLHGGVQLVMQYLRERFWITRMRQIVRAQIKRCVVCVRYKAIACQQQMGNLPEFRVQQAPPFKHTGVDYAGPVKLKAYEGARKIILNGYIAIFVCMVTRAIHIEVVSNLTSNAFLLAFCRFQARRGVECTNLYSDNSTTFVGAANQFEEVKRIWQSQALTEGLSTEGVVWNFITPRAPHQGGIWEAAVKSAKHHLNRVAKGTMMTFEQMYTLMAQIEACLNSRPLYSLRDDPQDKRVITPADFIGPGPMKTPLVTKQSSGELRLTKKWHFIQGLVNDFWKQWSQDYISSLHTCQKWNRRQANLQIGDVVVIIDELLPPAKWAMGRIVKVHEDKQKLVRNVVVKTEMGELSRPVQKLVWIPGESNGGRDV